MGWVLLVVMVAVVPNALARDLEAQVDLTNNRRNTLSGTTRDLLGSLEHEVRLLGVFKRENPDRQQAKELLERYEGSSPHLEVELIDPDTRPSVALEHGVDDGTILVFDGDRVEQAGSVNEYGVSTALWRAVNAQRVRLCATTGHGERGFGDELPDGFHTLRGALQGHGVSVEDVNLAQSGSVPESCQVLLLAAPQTAFTGSEVEALERYRRASGRFLVLLDPDSAAPDELLDRFQLASPAGRVFDRASSVEGDPASLLIEEYPSANPITEGLPPIALFDARAVIAPEIDALRSGLWVSRLLGASDEARFEEGRSLGDDAFLGAAADDSRISAKDSAIARSRLVVIGDSDFASNLFIEVLSGGSLFIRSVAWLAQAEELASISFRPPDSRVVFLKSSEARVVRWASYAITPGVFLVSALVLVLRRRRVATGD
jgi:hypothetical protein